MTTPNLEFRGYSFPVKIKKKTTVPWGYYQKDKQSKTLHAKEDWFEALAEAFDRRKAGESYDEILDFFKSKGIKSSKGGFLKLQKKYLGYEPVKREPKPNPEEVAEKKRVLKAAAEKRRITAAKKRLEKLEPKPELEGNSFSIGEPPKDEQGRNVVFKPNDGPQTEFLAAPEFEVLFGGAAGGGKSYALIADPIRYFDNKHFVGLLLRRTNDELRELIWKTKELYPQIYPDAKFSEKASEWRFPSGARMWMSYLDRDDDALRYQGQAYTWVGFDELTHWPTPYPLNFLRTRVRAAAGTGLEDKLAIRATTNPGGPGHVWVKKTFIDPAPYGKPFWATDVDTGDILRDTRGNPLFKRRFIPALLQDNPYLYEDGSYEANLSALPEKKRKQLLEGDWTVADGSEFEEFNPNVHICVPFDIDHTWTRFRSMDYGYSSYSAVHWYAIDPSDQQLIVYRELYVSKKTGEEIAGIINQLERGEKIYYGVLDSSVWHKRGEGPSVAEVMNQRGCRWRPADRSAGSRIAGKNRIHELLKVDPDTGKPGLVIFDTCRQLITDLPAIPSDPKGTDDIDKKYASDHTYDSLRYGVMSRPRSDPFGGMPPTRTVNVPDRVFGY